MLSQQETLDLLRRTGALREGHYRLTSGLHSDSFLIAAQTLQYPKETERLARAIASLFRGMGVRSVVGAAVGGIVLAYELARALDARALFAEKVPEGGMRLRRGFRLEKGERVLVAEDVVSTGGSVLKVIEAIRPFEPELIGVAAIVDRSEGKVKFGVPLRSLVTTDMPFWPADQCPLCQAGEPLIPPKG